EHNQTISPLIRVHSCSLVVRSPWRMSEPSDPLTVLDEGSRALDESAPPHVTERFAAALRRFGPLGILAIVLIIEGNDLFVPLSAILVLVWAWLSRTPWCEIGYVWPQSWIRSILIGITFGVALKFA